jgi:hypothetical protein
MRTAPAVHLSLEADTPWRVGLCLLGAAAAASLLLWLALWSHTPLLVALGAAAVAALTGAVLLWRRGGGDAVTLAWDGAQWWLRRRGEAEPRAGQMQLMVDLGAWLLLCFHPVQGACAHWVALSQARYRPHWHALRCALHARADVQGGAAGAPRQER